jgi:hypothetical protein
MDRQAIDVKQALVGRQPYVLLHICLFTCLVGGTKHGAKEILELCNKEASRLCHLWLLVSFSTYMHNLE